MRLSCMRLGQRDAVDVPAVDAGRAVQHGRADGPSLSGYDLLTGLIIDNLWHNSKPYCRAVQT